MNFKQIFLSTALLPVSGIASAADLPSRVTPIAPLPLIFNYTGLYIGGQLGYQWTASSSGTTYLTATGAPTATSANYNQAGVLGGAHLGYNYQVTNFVFGVEGDVEASSFYGAGPFATNAATTFRFLTSDKVQGSVRGRAGYVWGPLLVYATGGVALASIRDYYQLLGGAAGIDDNTGLRTGYTVGGGFEYLFRPNWSARIEYRYTDLGTHNDILANSTGGTIGDRRHETFNSARLV